MLGALAHAVGFPLPAGGSQAIIDAMVQDLRAHGGRLRPIIGSHRWPS